MAVVEPGTVVAHQAPVTQLHRLAEEQVASEPRLVGRAIDLAEDVPVHDVRDTRLPAGRGEERRRVSLAQVHDDVGSAQQLHEPFQVRFAAVHAQPVVLEHLPLGARADHAEDAHVETLPVQRQRLGGHPPLGASDSQRVGGEDDGRHQVRPT
jgi:hypothetical protein